MKERGRMGVSECFLSRQTYYTTLLPGLDVTISDMLHKEAPLRTSRITSIWPTAWAPASSASHQVKS